MDHSRADDRNGSSRSLTKLEQNLVEFLNTPATALMHAAESGDLEKLRELIAAGTQPGMSEIDGRTALHMAAAKGLLEVVHFLVDDAGTDLSPVDQWKTTPLDAAILEGHERVRAFLEARGAKRGAPPEKETDLCDAAAKGDLDRLRRLVAPGGIPVNQGDYDRRTALHLAASEGLLEVVRFLVDEAGADPSVQDRWEGTPLDDAYRHNHLAVVGFLSSKGAKSGRTSQRVTESELDTDLPANVSVKLCDAASKGDVVRLKHLVVDLGVDVDLGDYDKRTAMHLAASEGQLDVVKCLVLELRANPSPIDRWGGTPLDDALRSSHGPVAAFLRSQGAKKGVQSGQPGQSRACVLL